MLQHRLRHCRTAVIAAVAAAALAATPTTASAQLRPDRGQTGPGVRTEEPSVDELLAACPVDGAATFEDSWGWARSGGRSHKGVDLIADRGAPVVAVVEGDARFDRNGLGGNVVWLTSANGDRYYYAHLDAFAGESRSVQAGDVIGFVGSTGNAGGAHLHFETHPGGRAENPYLHTLAACVPTPEEIAAIEAHRSNALNDPELWKLFIPTT